MRLTRRALLIFWSYHAWAGVALGLVVYVMVLSGTITLFRKSLEIWEEPLRQQQVVSSPSKLQSDLDLGLAHIGAVPEELWLTLPEGGRGATSIGFERADDAPWEQLVVDSRAARAWPVREGLSTFLYHLHFLWHPAAQWLYYVAGVAAVGLLFAIVTGVLIHLRGLVRQYHRFRPHEAPRTVWSDLHKVLGVVGLPFQMFYAYSGALLVLGPPLVATLTSPLLGVGAARAKLWTGEEVESAESLGSTCEVRPIDELLSMARESISPEARVRTTFRGASIHHHGRETGWVDFEGATREFGAASREITVRVRERDGQVLAVPSTSPSAIRRFDGWIRALHFAEHGGMALRLLYGAMGIAAAITILSGNWIWIARRRGAEERWLARLTVGIGAGVLVAIAALFVASRVIPFDAARRPTSEGLVFAGALVACTAWGLAARRVHALWWKMCALAGLLFAVVPLAAAPVSTAGLLGHRGGRLGPVVAVDIALITLGIALMALAWLLQRRTALADLAVGTEAGSGERGAVVSTFRRTARGGPSDA